MALSRLRRLLGNGDTILTQGGRIQLDARRCWVDAWAFERVAEKAESLLPGQDPRSVESMEKTLSLYQGRFLPADAEHGWTVSMRDRLRRKHLSLTNAVAHYWEESGNDEKAVACYEKALEADNLAEDCYRRLMACYQRLGRPGAAMETYRLCRKLLAAELGITPSPATEALYAQLLGKV